MILYYICWYFNSYFESPSLEDYSGINIYNVSRETYQR